MSVNHDEPDNPFVRYRRRLDSYQLAIESGSSDEAFVALVDDFDSAVASVTGQGFRVTPTFEAGELAKAIGVDNQLWVKDETTSVAGSHKSRHLYGTSLHYLVARAGGTPLPDRFAIASCGNAALAASVMAAALKTPLDVFVPDWADASIIERLTEMGAGINRCQRQPGEQGDPAYLRYQEAVAGGATPFSVQGIETPTTFDGARTLGWELADQTGGVSELYVQVGGGALATSVGRAMPTAKLYPVQAEGCAPLRRAWDLLAPDFRFEKASESPHEYMWPWTPEPTSAASGILDDVTYDWLPLLRHTHATGGIPIVALEPSIVRANKLARTHTAVSVSTTGSAGLAGLLSRHPDSDGPVAVLFTGIS